MSSIRLQRASIVSPSSNRNYVWQPTESRLVLTTNNAGDDLELHLSTGKNGYADTKLLINGYHDSNDHVENVKIGYDSLTQTYQFRAQSTLNTNGKPLVLSNQTSTDMIRLNGDGTVVFNEDVDPSNSLATSVSVIGGLDVRKILTCDVLNARADVNLGGGTVSIKSNASSDPAAMSISGGVGVTKGITFTNGFDRKRISFYTSQNNTTSLSLGVEQPVGSNGSDDQCLALELPSPASAFRVYGPNVSQTPMTSSTDLIHELKADGTSIMHNIVDMSGNKIINLPDPANPTDACTKRYVDNTLFHYEPRGSVVAATYGNINISSGLGDGSTIDGIIVHTDDRVLVKDQTNMVENGIYVVGASVKRAEGMASGTPAAGAFFFVESGTRYGDRGFLCSSNSGDDIVDHDPLTFVQFTGLGQISGGRGIEMQDNIILTSSDQSHVTQLGTVVSGIWNASVISTAFGGTGRSSVIPGRILFGGSNTGDAFLDVSSLSYDSQLSVLSAGQSIWLGNVNTTGATYLGFHDDNTNNAITTTALTRSSKASGSQLTIFNANVDQAKGKTVIRTSSVFQVDVTSPNDTYDTISNSFTADSSLVTTPFAVSGDKVSVGGSTKLVVASTQNAVLSPSSTASIYTQGGILSTLDVLSGGNYGFINSTLALHGNQTGIVMEDASGTSSESRLVMQKTGSRTDYSEMKIVMYALGTESSTDRSGMLVRSVDGKSTLRTFSSGTATAGALSLACGSINTDQLILSADGQVTVSGTNDVSDITHASFVSKGGIAISKGALIGGTVTIGSTVKAVSSIEAHQFNATHANEAAISIKSTNASGNSTICMYSGDGTQKVLLGYSNSTGTAALTSTSLLTIGQSLAFNTNGTVVFTNTADATAATSASVCLNGGMWVKKSANFDKLVSRNGLDTQSVDGSLGAHQILRRLPSLAAAWNIYLSGASNTSCNYTVASYDDTGATMTDVLILNRTDGHVEIVSTEASTSSTTGSLRLNGGIYSKSNSLFDAPVIFNSTITATLGSFISKSGPYPNIVFQSTSGVTQWTMVNDTSTSDFFVQRYMDGVFSNNALTISSATNNVTFFGVIQNQANTVSLGAPSTTGERSPGTRQVFQPSIVAGQAEYAIGLSADARIWSSVPTSACGFSWYAGGTKILDLNGDATIRSGATSIFLNDLGTNSSTTQNIMFTRSQTENNSSSGQVVSGVSTETYTLLTTSLMNSLSLPVSTSSSIDGYYNGWYVKVRTGSAAGQVRKVQSYTSHVITVVTGWLTNSPTTGDTVDLYADVCTGIAFNSARNELLFVKTNGQQQQSQVVKYAETISGTLKSSGSFLTLGHDFNYDSSNVSADGDRGLVMVRAQTENNTGLGNVVNATEGPVFSCTLPSQTSAAANQVILASSASTTDGLYTGWWIKTGDSQVRQIVAYVGSTRLATVKTSWNTSLSIGSTLNCFSKSQVTCFYDESQQEFSIGFCSTVPSSYSSLNLVPQGYASVRSGTINSQGKITATGQIETASNVVIGTSGSLVTNKGTNAIHHMLSSVSGIPRISVGLYNTETGTANGGSDYAVTAYSDAGTPQSTPIFVAERSSGKVFVNSTTKIGNATGQVGALNISGDVALTNTGSNSILFNTTSSYGAPTVNSRSVGSKIVLLPQIGTYAADCAIGIESQGLWTSVPSDSFSFKWYSGATPIASMNKVSLDLTGDVNVAGYTDLGSGGGVQIRTKNLSSSLVTPTNDTDVLEVAHGLDGSKIISVYCIVSATLPSVTGVSYISPECHLQGCIYSLFWTTTFVYVSPKANDASYVLNKPVRLVVTYTK